MLRGLKELAKELHTPLKVVDGNHQDLAVLAVWLIAMDM